MSETTNEYPPTYVIDCDRGCGKRKVIPTSLINNLVIIDGEYAQGTVNTDAKEGCDRGDCAGIGRFETVVAREIDFLIQNVRDERIEFRTDVTDEYVGGDGVSEPEIAPVIHIFSRKRI